MEDVEMNLEWKGSQTVVIDRTDAGSSKAPNRNVQARWLLQPMIICSWLISVNPFHLEYVPDPLYNSRPYDALTCVGNRTKTRCSLPIAYFGEVFQSIRSQIHQFGSFFYPCIIRSKTRSHVWSSGRKSLIHHHLDKIRHGCSSHARFFCLVAASDCAVLSCTRQNIARFKLLAVGKENQSAYTFFAQFDESSYNFKISIEDDDNRLISLHEWLHLKQSQDGWVVRRQKEFAKLNRNPTPREGPRFIKLKGEEITSLLANKSQQGRPAIIFCEVDGSELEPIKHLRDSITHLFNFEDESIDETGVGSLSWKFPKAFILHEQQGICCIHLVRKQSDVFSPGIDEFAIIQPVRPSTTYSVLGFPPLTNIENTSLKIFLNHFKPFHDLVQTLNEYVSQNKPFFQSPQMLPNLANDIPFSWQFSAFRINGVSSLQSLKALARKGTLSSPGAFICLNTKGSQSGTTKTSLDIDHFEGATSETRDWRIDPIVATGTIQERTFIPTIQSTERHEFQSSPLHDIAGPSYEIESTIFRNALTDCEPDFEEQINNDFSALGDAIDYYASESNSFYTYPASIWSTSHSSNTFDQFDIGNAQAHFIFITNDFEDLPLIDFSHDVY